MEGNSANREISREQMTIQQSVVCTTPKKCASKEKRFIEKISQTKKRKRKRKNPSK